ncbi:pseudoazurin [Pseudomonas sp. Marseille-QA0892]
MKKHLALALLTLASPFVMAETHEVRMYSKGETGKMVYQPDFIAIAPGDSVHFVTDHGKHDSATIPGLLPEGAKPFKSEINENITVTFDVPGVYGIQCTPHLSKGMVMLVQVGDKQPAPELPEGLPDVAKQRLDAVIEREYQQ